MRRKKLITIGTHKVIVSEISASHVLALMQGEDSIISLPPTEALERVKTLLPLAVSVPLADLMKEEVYFDDLKTFYEALRETNPMLFETVKALNLGNVLANAFQNFTGSFSSKLLSSLNPDPGQ